jgi:hypothetical protein
MWARMSGAFSFGTFSLGKDKSVWNRFEQPKAGPEGEVQDGLHKRYSSMKDETITYVPAQVQNRIKSHKLKRTEKQK